MAWVVVLVPLALLCNLFLLAGMLAGSSSLWRRRAALAGQVGLLALGMFVLTALVPLAANPETRGATKLAMLLALFVALGIGTLLTFVEYAVAGRRREFLSDLGHFNWFGR